MLESRFRVEASFVEEYADSEEDHWATESSYFEAVEDAVEFAVRRNEDEIHIEIFNSVRKSWEHLLTAPVVAFEMMNFSRDESL